MSCASSLPLLYRKVILHKAFLEALPDLSISPSHKTCKTRLYLCASNFPLPVSQTTEDSIQLLHVFIAGCRPEERPVVYTRRPSNLSAICFALPLQSGPFVFVPPQERRIAPDSIKSADFKGSYFAHIDQRLFNIDGKTQYLAGRSSYKILSVVYRCLGRNG